MPELAGGGRTIFDALIVGSSATGGAAAKELTKAGQSVALMDSAPRPRATNLPSTAPGTR